MNHFEDVHTILNDRTIDIDIWAKKLRESHAKRSLSFHQTNAFYFKRNLVEYSVKMTVSGSMAIALLLGGPPFWILSGAALILKLTTLLLNQFTPSQYIETEVYEPELTEAKPINKNQLEAYRLQWQTEHQHYLFSNHVDKQKKLQQRLAFTLFITFAAFTLIHANLTIPIAFAGIAFALFLIEKTQETAPPYLEEQNDVNNLFVLNSH